MSPRPAPLRAASRGAPIFQCGACREQTSLIAGTVFQGTKLALTVWYLAIYLISQAKTGLSALALKRLLGVSDPTAWLIHHELVQAMVEREERYLLGGELSGGTAGRGSENKVPFLAAVSVDANGHPRHAKLTPVSGFTRKAVTAWASAHLAPGSVAVTDGLSCFKGVGDAGCVHQPVVVGEPSPAICPTCSGSTPSWATSRPASSGPTTPSSSASMPSATSAPLPTDSTGASSWTR